MFLAELKRWLEEQLDDPSSGVSCVLSPYQLTIYYRGETRWFVAGDERGRALARHTRGRCQARWLCATCTTPSKLLVAHFFSLCVILTVAVGEHGQEPRRGKSCTARGPVAASMRRSPQLRCLHSAQEPTNVDGTPTSVSRQRRTETRKSQRRSS